MKIVASFLVMALCSSAAFADYLSRGGYVVYEDGDSFSSGWALLIAVGVFAYLAWDQGEKRSQEQLEARRYADDLRQQLREKTQEITLLQEQISNYDDLRLLCDMLLDGLLTEEDFFYACLKIMHPKEYSAVVATPSSAEIERHNKTLKVIDSITQKKKDQQSRPSA